MRASFSPNTLTGSGPATARVRVREKQIPSIWSAVAAVSLLFIQDAAHADTTINVSSTIQVADVRRFGIDIPQVNYYDSNQLLKDFIFVRNANFEGQIYQSVVRCGPNGTATSAIEDQSYGGWPSGFWDGATYEFIYGGAAGRTGTITHSVAPNRAQTPNDAAGSTQGTTYNFAESAVAPADGDYFILRKTMLGDAATGGSAKTGLNVNTGGGGTITSETSDLPPDTPGKQCVRLSAAGAGQTATLNTGFDTWNGMSFVTLSGSFQLTFKAKGVGGNNQLLVQLRRGSNPYYINQTVQLTSAWQNYTLTFSASENGTQSGAVPLLFMPVNQSAVLLDDTSITQTNTDPTNTTVFRDSVIAALRTYNPGILRGTNWQQLGDTLDNQLSVPQARQRTGYSSWGTVQQTHLLGLHEYLVICEAIGTDPWYSMPMTFSTQEAANLMEYLGGSTSTPYGARRAALGHTAPWTSVFNRIHIELGNENWNNGAYRGGCISDPVAYGTRGNVIFGTMKASPYYSSTQFDFILGAQAVNANYALQIHNASANHDNITVAPYMNTRVDTFATNEDMFGPLLAEPEWWCRNPTGSSGFMRTIFNTIQGSSRPVPISNYEDNVNTTDGSISQAALDNLVPSIGSGLAIADQMLLMLHDLNMRDQCLFSLGGYRATRSDNKTVAIWGVTRDMGVTDRKRPQYLALQLVNQALVGNMVATMHSGDDPTWDQPLVNRVSYTGAHYLQSYATNSGQSKSVIVFNMHRTNQLSVNFSGPNAPSGSVSMQQLNSANITDNNESAQNVNVVSSSFSNFDPNPGLMLPPFSMTLLKWTQSAADAWRYTNLGTTSNTGTAADTADPDQDGVNNLLEYALNTNPQNASSRELPTSSISNISGQNYLTLTVTKNPSATDLAYTVEVTSDLVNWFSGPTYTTTITNTSTSLVVRDNTPMSSNPRRFIRLKVTR